MKISPLTDSHLHFDTFEDEGQTDRIIQEAHTAGVSRLIAIGGSLNANALAMDVASRYSGQVFPVVGYDRDGAGKSPDLATLSASLSGGRAVGVGETGLDYHYEPETRDEQRTLFQSMLDVAHEHALPTIVHSREAESDTLEHLSAQSARWKDSQRPCAILHCFTGDRSFAEKLLNLNLMVSFSGILTFKSAESIREAAMVVPDDRMLIETDAPYLAPVPFRGKTNEPRYVVNVAEMLADIRGVSFEHIAKTTTANAARIFRLP